jgi:hypothetical protein
VESPIGHVTLWDTSRADSSDRLQRSYSGSDAALIFFPLEVDGSMDGSTADIIKEVGELRYELERNVRKIAVVFVGYTHGKRDLGPGMEREWNQESGVEVEFPLLLNPPKEPPKKPTRYGIPHISILPSLTWRGAQKDNISWDEGLELAKTLAAVAYAEVDVANEKGLNVVEEICAVARCRHPAPLGGVLLNGAFSGCAVIM